MAGGQMELRFGVGEPLPAYPWWAEPSVGGSVEAAGGGRGLLDGSQADRNWREVWMSVTVPPDVRRYAPSEHPTVVRYREERASLLQVTGATESRLRNSWGWRLGAVLNSPGKHPFALDRRLDAGSGGPAARREVEVGLFRRVADRASEHRWVTDAGRAPRGVAGGALVMSPGVRAGRR